MPIRDAILAEFDHEMASTRKSLSRVPADKLDFRPHDKSYTLRQLASHLANIPSWTPETLEKDSIDLAPPDGSGFKTPQAESTADLLSWFDGHVAAARASIAKASDEQFHEMWSLKAGNQVYFTLPKIAVLRSFVLNHNIHHRAQLGVYLRLNDVPVPAIYGPSADEQSM